MDLCLSNGNPRTVTLGKLLKLNVNGKNKQQQHQFMCAYGERADDKHSSIQNIRSWCRIQCMES